MRKATSSGAGGHLYGMPAMPMTIRPPSNASSAVRRRSGGLGAVEVVGLGVEMLDRLGHDPRPGGEHELVVARAAGRRRARRSAPLVDALDLADDELDPRVEQAALRSVRGSSARSPPIAMYMKPAGRRARRSASTTVIVDVAASIRRRSFLDQQVGGERAADAAAEDQDPLHRAPSAASSRRRSRRSHRGSRPRRACGRPSRPTSGCRSEPLVRGVDGDDIADLSLADGADELHQRTRAEAAAGVDDPGDRRGGVVVAIMGMRRSFLDEQRGVGLGHESR